MQLRLKSIKVSIETKPTIQTFFSFFNFPKADTYFRQKRLFTVIAALFKRAVRSIHCTYPVIPLTIYSQILIM